MKTQAVDIDAIIEKRLAEERAKAEERFRRMEFLLEETVTSPTAKALLEREKKGEQTGVLVRAEDGE